MRKSLMLCASLYVLAPQARAEMPTSSGTESILMPPTPAEIAAEPGFFDPAYHFAEGVSDGVYDFMRRDVVGVIFPETLARSLRAAPLTGSTPLFDKNLRDNEERFMARARSSYPVTPDGDTMVDGAPLEAWRRWAVAEQVSVAVGSFKDTLINRYQLELFGGNAGTYAMNPRNWDPSFLSMAGVLGGTFLNVNGMHATTHIGAIKLGFDLASGLKFRQALRRGNGSHLAHLELGYRDLPLTLSSEWGMNERRMRSDLVGVNYRLRF